VGVAVRSSADLARALSALRIRTGSSLETCVVRPALTVAATLAFLEVAGIPLARQALALGLIGSAPRRRRYERIHPTGGDQPPESGGLGQTSRRFDAVRGNSWGVWHSHFAIRGVSATHTSRPTDALLSARSCSLVSVRQQAETYPLRRSFLEERLGHAIGVVQFDAKRLEETASATTLACS
jgi:hypothetical protein